MSVRGRIVFRALVARCVAILPLLMVAALAACSDGIFSPNQVGRGQLQLKPVFSSVDWQSLSANINVIRVSATQLPARALVLRQETTVDPSASEWQLPLDLPVNSEVEVLVELINRVNSVDIIVYSGRTLLKVKSSGQPTAALVPVFPGPPDNLDITDLTITPKNQDLLEGDQAQLSASVVGTSNPTILWSSSNPDVLVVDEHGALRAAGLGQATIQAVAGPKSDNVTITVSAKASGIQLTPSNATLLSLDDEVVFNGKVFDARNAQLNLPVTYQISDPSIALHTGNGRFRARRSGEAIVTATAVQNGSPITASATLRVRQTAATLSLTPSNQTFSSLGDTQTLTADARDGKGNPIPSTDLNWLSSDASIATVDGSGVVTALRNGNVVIRVTSGSVGADAQIEVKQVAASLSLAPNSLTLNVGETHQFIGIVSDARGNTMNVPITWSIVGNAEVAKVNTFGVVRADNVGSVSVSAKFNTLVAHAPITVKAIATQIIFDRPALQLVTGETQQISAYLANAFGEPSPGDPIIYSIADPSIATINSIGVVSAVRTGTTEIIATSQNLQRRLPVTVVVPVQGDIVVIPDLNVFGESPAAPSNRLMLKNIVTFTGTSVRGNGNTVWLPQDDQPCAFCDKTFDFIRSQIKQTGLITQRAAAGNDRLTGVPTNVKALFLFVQTMTFSANEVAVLRAFVSTGGRLVLIGGHETTASQQPGLNTLLAALGSGLRGGQSLGCGRDVVPASSLRAHQITTGMTEFRPGCAMELSLGSGDKGLIYDATNTVAVIALTSTGGPN